MDYSQFNSIHTFFMEEILPSLKHHMTVASFDDYLKRFGSGPSGKWIREMDNVMISRCISLIDPVAFVKKYDDYCVTFGSPAKPEDGIMRAIYQFTPTLHAEVVFWIWEENKEVHSYCTVTICHHTIKEYTNFVNALYEIRRDGDTKDAKPTGFGGGPAIGFGG